MEAGLRLGKGSELGDIRSKVEPSGKHLVVDFS